MINDNVNSDMLQQIEENLWKTLNQTKDTIPALYTAAIYLKVALKIYKSILSHNELKNLLHMALKETPALMESEFVILREEIILPKVKKVLH